jgi:folate-binding protein YgfZ
MRHLMDGSKKWDGTMAEKSYVLLEERGIIAVTGEDWRQFLQGMVSNDVMRIGADRAIHAAFLTPQGKYLHDFFMAETGDGVLLDCERERAADLMRRLGIYKLRAKVAISECSDDFAVAALFGDSAVAGLGLASEPGAATVLAGGTVFVDPRLAAAGARAILPKDGARQALEAAGFAAAPGDAYDTLRLRLGLPDGSRDLVVDKAILLENGFDELNGVDFDKGCYMGQELTSRTKHRALIRKRLLPVVIDGPPPPAGTEITLDGEKAGEMRSAHDGLGLALMRLEQVEKASASGGGTFEAGEARLTPHKPDWAIFPEAADA